MKSLLKHSIALVALMMLGLITIAVGAWGSLALWYFDDANIVLRGTLCGLFALATLLAVGSIGWRRWRWRAMGAYLALFAVLLLCWGAQRPTNERDWQTDVAVLPYATVNGDQITMHNIRNFEYRTETDYTPGYYDKAFNLRELSGIDLIAVYWMGPQIAHIFLSFDFGDQGHLAISIEARKPKNEGFSTVKGFFRQYELYYVVADERDVIRLRTNYRHDPPEEVHVYRLHGSPEDMKRMFLSYVTKINSLKNQPEFYNSLTTNCTTNIWLQSRVNPDHLPFSWKIIVSGYVPEYAYESGLLDSSIPFLELQRRSIVNERAHAADQAADFSARIRVEPNGNSP